MLTVMQDGESFRARDQRKSDHFWADKEIVEDHLPEMGIYAFSVYMLLCYYSKAKTGRSWPSIATLAKKLKVSEPTIRKALEELVTQKLIVVSESKRLSKNGKAIPRPHIFTLLEVKKHREIEGGVVNQVDQGGKPPLPGVVNQVDPNKTYIEQDSNEQDSLLPDAAPQIPATQSFSPALPPRTEIWYCTADHQRHKQDLTVLGEKYLCDLPSNAPVTSEPWLAEQYTDCPICFGTPVATSGQGKVTVIEVELNPPSPPIAVAPASPPTMALVPRGTELPLNEIIIGGTPEQPLVVTFEEFAKRVPPGFIARYRVTAWDGDGQFKSDYRLVHYNKGSASRMSRESLCGNHTGSEYHHFYSNEPWAEDYQGGATPFKVCSECASVLANPPLPAPNKTRWITPIGEQMSHLVKNSNLPERTLCGITPLPSYASSGAKSGLDQCQDCLRIAQAPAKRVRAPQPTDPLFNALGLHVLSAKTPADVEAVGWRINQIMNGDKKYKRSPGLIAYERERQGKEDLDFAALAKDIKPFWDWYQEGHPGYELKDVVKFMEQWVAWRSTSAPIVQEELVPHPELPGRTMTASQYRLWQIEQEMLEAHNASK